MLKLISAEHQYDKTTNVLLPDLEVSKGENTRLVKYMLDRIVDIKDHASCDHFGTGNKLDDARVVQ